MYNKSIICIVIVSVSLLLLLPVLSFHCPCQWILKEFYMTLWYMMLQAASCCHGKAGEGETADNHWASVCSGTAKIH